MRKPAIPILAALAVVLVFASCEGKIPAKIGEFCLEETDCESGMCKNSQCLNPDDDYDSDGLKNGIEKNITGTDYADPDSDGDGIDDGIEVGKNPNLPADEDGDGIPDALESSLPEADPDMDCIPDQFDPDNNTKSDDLEKIAELYCSTEGVCGTWFEKVTASCVNGEPVCDYSAVPDFEVDEVTCDKFDNDCDGSTDKGLTAPDEPECRSEGVCAGNEAKVFRMCRGGEWVCEYSSIDNFENIESSCDGLDNNCDGETDENLVGMECFNRNEHGKCPGITECNDYEGVDCVGPIPAAEICNGVDDDCDGETDEELTGIACTRKNIFGVCSGVTVCNMVTGGTDCDAPIPAPESCDSIDNDCDGKTDEEMICARTSGIMMTVYGATVPALSDTPFFTVEQENAYTPLSGATVEFFMSDRPETDDTGPDWTSVSNDNGMVDVPLQPGLWYVQISAEGFQTAVSGFITLAEGQTLPLEIILLLNGMATPQLSICGRTLEAPEHVINADSIDNTGDGTTDIPVDYEDVPVSGVNITLTESTAEETIGTTTSDENGYWCLVGLPTIQSGSELLLGAIKDGYFPNVRSVWPNINSLEYTTIQLEPIPETPTLCMSEDFEQGFEMNGWTVTQDITSSVTWNSMASRICVAPVYSLECAMTFPNEEPDQTTGSLLCTDPDIISDGCIPEPGSLPGAFGGTHFAWFGNPMSCCYSDGVQSCDHTGTRAGGSLVSPWIDASNTWTLTLSFMSAWEVEPYDSGLDAMYVELQTSSQSTEGTWTTIGIVNAMQPTENPVSVSRAQTPVAFTSGGDNSAPTWQRYEIDLAGFVEESFKIRFRFDSKDGNNNLYRGWQIDEVRILGRGCQPGLE